MPKLTIKKLRPARFTRPAQFITIGLYSLMIFFPVTLSTAIFITTGVYNVQQQGLNAN